MNKEQIDLKIENKLISKIANHRLMARETFRDRHKNPFPEVGRGQCFHHINELRVWLRMAEIVDISKSMDWISDNPIKPYETYYAEELTKNK
jgi:hypothetical protein